VAWWAAHADAVPEQVRASEQLDPNPDPNPDPSPDPSPGPNPNADAVPEQLPKAMKEQADFSAFNTATVQTLLRYAARQCHQCHRHRRSCSCCCCCDDYSTHAAVFAVHAAAQPRTRPDQAHARLSFLSWRRQVHDVDPAHCLPGDGAPGRRGVR